MKLSEQRWNSGQKRSLLSGKAGY